MSKLINKEELLKCESMFMDWHPKICGAADEMNMVVVLFAFLCVCVCLSKVQLECFCDPLDLSCAALPRMFNVRVLES